MIQIRMDTKRLKLKINGHAMAEESEKHKEICAAASALAQGLVFSISKSDAKKEMQYRPDSGNLFLLVMPEKGMDALIRIRFVLYADGMELMALAHPGSVHMIRDGEEIKNFGGDENE